MRSTLGFVMNLGILISKVAMAAVMNKKPSDTSGMLEIIFIGPGQSAPPPLPLPPKSCFGPRFLPWQQKVQSFISLKRR